MPAAAIVRLGRAGVNGVCTIIPPSGRKGRLNGTNEVENLQERLYGKQAG